MLKSYIVNANVAFLWALLPNSKKILLIQLKIRFKLGILINPRRS